MGKGVRATATLSNCGETLRARGYQVAGETQAMAKCNGLGMVKRRRDWAIRSEVLRGHIFL